VAMAGDRLHEAQAEECLWFSWFSVLFHCFMICLSCPRPYMIYFLPLWHDIAYLC